MDFKEGSKYTIDPNKIKTIKDVRIILSKMKLTYTPHTKEDFEGIKHLLKEDEKGE